MLTITLSAAGYEAVLRQPMAELLHLLKKGNREYFIIGIRRKR